MRILIASGIFHPEIGGPATYLEQILPELLKRGHTLTVVSFGDSSPAARYPYPVHRVARRHWFARHWEYYWTVSRLWPGHDLAFIHSLGLPLPRRLSPRVGRIGGDPVWERAVNRGWVAPDVDVQKFQTACRHPLVRLSKALYHQEVRGLDRIVVPCQFCRRLVTSWGADPAKVTVIHNAIRPMSIPQETRSAVRRQLGLPDARLLLTVTRLTSFKGIDYLIRAVARVNDLHLIVAGDGPIRRELLHLTNRLGVSDRVHFLGYVPRDGLPALFRAADYTVAYAGGEGLSHTLLESLAIGTPVIASDLGGNPEVISHGKNGWLVPFPDVNKLVDAIHRAFLPAEQARSSANCSLGLERFSWEQMVEQTALLIESFSTGRR